MPPGMEDRPSPLALVEMSLHTESLSIPPFWGVDVTFDAPALVEEGGEPATLQEVLLEGEGDCHLAKAILKR